MRKVKQEGKMQVMVRVSDDIIQELRHKYPELKGENNTYLVRYALRKLLSEANPMS